jgi:hypothetical protein
MRTSGLVWPVGGMARLEVSRAAWAPSGASSAGHDPLRSGGALSVG